MTDEVLVKSLAEYNYVHVELNDQISFKYYASIINNYIRKNQCQIIQAQYFASLFNKIMIFDKSLLKRFYLNETINYKRILNLVLV